MAEKDFTLEVLLDFFDAVEAGIAAAKQRIKEAKVEEPRWDPNRLKWVDCQGTSGPYQRYPAEGEKVELTQDYKNMVADLKAHNGKLSRKDPDGTTWFYWIFQDGATIGRKPRQKQKAESQAQPASQKIEAIKGLFPADLQGLLNFEVQNDVCIIKPRTFLGSENFGKIAEIVRKSGGDYISAGKDSHFHIRIP